MKILDSIYKRKYEKLKKDFDKKVNQKANALYRDRQDNWKIKEEEYKQEIRFKTLEIREKRIELENLNKYVDEVLNENDRNQYNKSWYKL